MSGVIDTNTVTQIAFVVKDIEITKKKICRIFWYGDSELFFDSKNFGKYF